MTLAKVGRRNLVPLVLIATVSIMAVLALRLWSITPLGGFLMVAGLGAHWPHHLVFLIDWTLMCAAMMLPTALPLTAAALRMFGGRRDRLLLLAVLIGGYIGVWIASGIVLRAAGMWLSAADFAWPIEHRQGIAGAGLIFGGVYLTTPFAAQCLTACRSPMGFVATHWGKPGPVAINAFRIGLAYGLSCFGCCWPLMLAMAIFSLASPFWMLAATAFMILQKSGKEGLTVTRTAGFAMMAAGGAVGSGVARVAINPNLWDEAMRFCGAG